MAESCHLNEFDYFRGICIFVVVMWHMNMLVGEHEFVMSGYAKYSKLFAFTFNCSTAFFVFMSGFMFFWLYYQRGFQYKIFLQGKFHKLFRPYFLIATIFSLIHVVYGAYTGRLAEWNFWVNNAFERFLLNTWMYWSFWYMPFIAVVFVLSPLYLKFIDLRCRWQFVIIICALIVSCSLGRENTNPFQSCAYFSVYYLFGIVCAQNYELIRNFSVKLWLLLPEIYLFLILFAAAFGQYNYGAVIMPTLAGYTITDFTPVFKLPECLLFLWAAEKLANVSEWLKKALLTMGKYSFAIFFLHNFFIAAFEEIFFWANMEFPLRDTAWLHVVGFAMTVVVCKICIFVAAWLKDKIGANSRIYIGV